MRARVFALLALSSLPAYPALPAHPALAAALPAFAQSAPRSRPRLLAPLDLGVLERADREQWNKPEQIMDALKIADGSIVAEIGAGGGWFTVRLAHRVNQKGVVYAEDIQPEMIAAVKLRAQRENLGNVVRTVLGTTRNSRLPHGLDAILINGAFHEMQNPVAVLKDAAESLKPQGRLGIVEYSPGAGGPGPEPEQRVDQEAVVRDATAAGLQVISRETIPPFMFMVVLGTPSGSKK